MCSLLYIRTWLGPLCLREQTLLSIYRWNQVPSPKAITRWGRVGHGAVFLTLCVTHSYYFLLWLSCVNYSNSPRYSSCPLKVTRQAAALNCVSAGNPVHCLGKGISTINNKGYLGLLTCNQMFQMLFFLWKLGMDFLCSEPQNCSTRVIWFSTGLLTPDMMSNRTCAVSQSYIEIVSFLPQWDQWPFAAWRGLTGQHTCCNFSQYMLFGCYSHNDLPVTQMWKCLQCNLLTIFIYCCPFLKKILSKFHTHTYIYIIIQSYDKWLNIYFLYVRYQY